MFQNGTAVFLLGELKHVAGGDLILIMCAVNWTKIPPQEGRTAGHRPVLRRMNKLKRKAREQSNATAGSVVVACRKLRGVLSSTEERGKKSRKRPCERHRENPARDTIQTISDGQEEKTGTDVRFGVQLLRNAADELFSRFGANTTGIRVNETLLETGLEQRTDGGKFLWDEKRGIQEVKPVKKAAYTPRLPKKKRTPGNSITIPAETIVFKYEGQLGELVGAEYY
ncbi:hypothetical protein B0H14DRAFT_2601641 [Mycena olivaceomarginata]|nr:hypothetical protein B0H14DRAFT_2601641 [Mycena olivaceomarginata]